MRATWILGPLIKRISVDSGMNTLTPRTTLASATTNAAPGTSLHPPPFQRRSQHPTMCCNMLGIRRRTPPLSIESAWTVALLNQPMPKSAASTQLGHNRFLRNSLPRRRKASKSFRQISSLIWSQLCAKTSACSTILTTLF